MKKIEGGFRSRWTSINGFNMHALAAVKPSFSDQQAMVLIHGLSVSHRYWAPTAELLRLRCNVWMPDLPGFGRSEKPERALDLPELADALAEWMETNHLGQAVLVGNSMGCQVIVELALRRPDLIHRAVLTAPSIDPDRRSAPAQIWSGMWDLPYEPIGLLMIVFQDYLITGLPRTLRTLRFAVQDPIVEKLPQVRIPTLVVRGENDRVASQEWAEKMTTYLPDGRLCVISDAAHGVIYSRPKALVDAIDQFLAD